jgi:hypothetical protein
MPQVGTVAKGQAVRLVSQGQQAGVPIRLAHQQALALGLVQVAVVQVARTPQQQPKVAQQAQQAYPASLFWNGE